MASQLSFKLTNRAPNKPIKRLPPTLELSRETTVEEAKKEIARQTGLGDFNRVGLFDPTTKRTLKDRKALVAVHDGVMKTGEIQVKDLGPQLAWRTVYVAEYFGPILFHALVPLLRSYIYAVPTFRYRNEAKMRMSKVQWLLLALIQLHFLKRELETLFLHRFSANTMPAWFVVRNSFFYWAVAGLAGAFEIYAPRGLAARSQLGFVDYVGIALFVYGEVCNFIVHLHLATLRQPGGTEKGIPNCIGSSLVTCPNYMFEVIAWAGIILMSRSLAMVVFIAIGTYYMKIWSVGKEKALRQTFGDRYKKKHYGVLPGIF